MDNANLPDINNNLTTFNDKINSQTMHSTSNHGCENK